MISHGKSSKVDEHMSDLMSSSHGDDNFYSELKDDILAFSAGKLGQEKYKGTLQ